MASSTQPSVHGHTDMSSDPSMEGPSNTLSSSVHGVASSSEASQSTLLSAAAPVFQPSGGFNQAAPTPRIGLNPHASPFDANRTPSLSLGTLQPPSLSFLQPTSPIIGIPSPNLSTYSVSPGGSSPLSPNWMLLSTSNQGKGGRRSSRNGPLNQPLKTTGHNSKPSVNFNSAALSTLMGSQRPKRKTIVRLPREGSDSADEEHVLEKGFIAEQDKGEDNLNSNGEEKKEQQHMRKRWQRRWPLTDVNVEEVGSSLPADCILSSKIYPEQEHYPGGLPEFIDIYLPVQGAWEELKEVFLQERLDEGMEDQEIKEMTGTSHLLGEVEEDGSASPLSTTSPQQDASSFLGTKHNQNMSLSIRSSGKPFGPSAMIALGLPSPISEQMRRASDSEVNGSNVKEERGLLERSVSDQSTYGKAQHDEAFDSILKELGRGFGYDVEENKEGGEEQLSSLHSSLSSLSPPRRQKQSPVENTLKAGQVDIKAERTNQVAGPWQDQRRQVSGFNSNDSVEDEGRTDSEPTDVNSVSGEYSNPSDEEAARETRVQERSLRQRGRDSEPTLKVQEIDQRTLTRPRSGTGDTFASSCIYPEDMDPPRLYSMLPRGPLDHDQSGLDYIAPSHLYSSRLHPDAPVFAPRHQSSTSSYPPPLPKQSTSESNNLGHTNRGSLNATAPAFTPAAFTFTVPGLAPRLPSLYPSTNEDEVARDGQGREKRQRQRDEVAVDPNGTSKDSSPPRLHLSTASVGDPKPLPFNGQITHTSPISQRKPQESNGSFTFKPNAEPFYPSSRPASLNLATSDESQEVLKPRKLSGQTQRSTSNNSMTGKRTPATSIWQQGDAPAMESRPSHQSSSTSKLGRYMKSAAVNSGDVVAAEDSDDDSLSDIIEELCDRMDMALEGWAGRILDEVTIMAQIRPMANLDTAEKQGLVEMICKELQSVFGLHSQDLLGNLQEINARQEKMLEVGMVGGDVKSKGSPMNRLTIGHTSLEAQEDDDVKGSLDEKLSKLQRDLGAKFETALIRAMETVSRQTVEVQSLDSSSRSTEATSQIDTSRETIEPRASLRSEDTSQMVRQIHQSILDKLESLNLSGIRGSSDVDLLGRLNVLEQSRDTLEQQLHQARQAESEARMELKVSSANASTLREECDRLEARLDQVEKDANDISIQMGGDRKKEHEAVERCLLAESRAAEIEAESREGQVLLRASEDQNQLLRSQIEQLTAEIADGKEQRAKERETSAKSTAEALASRDEADKALLVERKAREELTAQSVQIESKMRQEVKEVVVRAAKAEGQVMALEKRMSEQDAKIHNLQQLTATQKQKAAQGGQKLAEMEKKVKELEATERDLTVAQTRLTEMEARLRNQTALEGELKGSQQSESRLKEEVLSQQASFLDLERDLLQMKETLVDRQSFEEVTRELTISREEVLLLRSQLAKSQERQDNSRQEQQQRPSSVVKKNIQTGKHASSSSLWERSPSHGSSTWASLHGPHSSIDELDPTQPSYADDSIDSTSTAAFRDLSYMSISRSVEVNDDGWWV